MAFYYLFIYFFNSNPDSMDRFLKFHPNYVLLLVSKCLMCESGSIIINKRCKLQHYQQTTKSITAKIKLIDHLLIIINMLLADYIYILCIQKTNWSKSITEK